MDCIQYRYEVLLAQSVNEIVHDQFEAAESTYDSLFIFELKRFAQGGDNDAPAFIADLLSALLNDLLESFDHGALVLSIV
jgi:hypothetical protein